MKTLDLLISPAKVFELWSEDWNQGGRSILIWSPAASPEFERDGITRFVLTAEATRAHDPPGRFPKKAKGGFHLVKARCIFGLHALEMGDQPHLLPREPFLANAN